MKTTCLSKLMAASALLLGMLVLPSCGDSESNIAEEPGTEIDGGENDTIASNFDHEVTQPAPGGRHFRWRSAGVSHITSVAGVPLVRLNNGVMMPRFGLGTQVQSMEGASQRQELNETVRGMVISALSRAIVIWTMLCSTTMNAVWAGEYVKAVSHGKKSG